MLGECEKQRCDDRFENSTTVKVAVGDDESVKTKIVPNSKSFFGNMFVTLLIPSIHNILQPPLEKENINVR